MQRVFLAKEHGASVRGDAESREDGSGGAGGEAVLGEEDHCWSGPPRWIIALAGVYDEDDLLLC